MAQQFSASVSARFYFEAAHHMPTFPEGHPNRRVHGHSYGVDVVVHGPVDPVAGYVMDHGDLVLAVQPVMQQLDHSYLNEVSGLEMPTSEFIARWLWQRLKSALPLLSEIVIHRDSVGIRVTYKGEGA